MGSPLIEEIRKHGEEFLPRLYRYVYLTSSGLDGKDNFGDIYGSHAPLFEPDLVISLREAKFREQEEITGKSLLLSFLLRHLMESRMASVRDELLGLECGQEIEWGGRALSLRDGRIAIIMEPKRQAREEIAEKMVSLMGKVNERLLRALNAWHSVSQELGYESYLSMVDQAGALELERLKGEARVFLKDTEYACRDLLRWILNKRMPLAEPRWHDLEFLLNSFEYADYFGKGDLHPSLKKFLDELGIEEIRRVNYDLEPRACKLRTVETLPIDPPREIAFAIYPVGSVEDYSSFLLQLGKALSFALVPEDDLFEFRFLRDGTALEALGSLFENLLLEPTWLRRYLRLDLTRNLAVLLSFRYLWRMRLAIGRFLYSLELHQDEDFPSKSDIYRKILNEATLCKHEPLHYLIEEEPFLGAACRLRGLMLESHLAPYIKERFDEQWWRMPEAIEHLSTMWEAGGRTTGEGIAKGIELKKLDLSAILHRLESALG